MHDQYPAHKSAAEQVKAWDADFTKVTPEEAQRIKAAEESGFVADSDIDWDHLSDMKLDEADKAAITSDTRFTGEEVFSRVRQRIEQQHTKNPL